MAQTATSDIEQFMATLVQCDKLTARITATQCATNRSEAKRRDVPGTLWHCLHCDGLPGAVDTAVKPKRGRRRKAAPVAQVETVGVNNPRSPWRFNPARQSRQSTEIEVSDGIPCGDDSVRAPGSGVARAPANQATITSEIEGGGGVPSPPAETPAKSPNQTPPGIFVDFSGYEDLLVEFEAACAERGFSPSESALDIIYLFVTGKLAVIRKGP
jgi:hypothetical protein